MYKAVIFDLDGTLVNSLFDLADSMNKALTANGLPAHPVACYKRFVGSGRDQLIERAVGKEKLTPQLKDSLTRFFDEDYAVHCMDKTKPYEGMQGLLERLHTAGIMAAVLSNKPDRFVKEMMRRLFLGVRFTLAWGKKPEYKEKPDPSALFAMLNEMKVEKMDCLYVGDSDVDVYTAQNAGLPFCGVEWGFRGREELLDAGAQATVKTAAELLTFIMEGTIS